MKKFYFLILGTIGSGKDTQAALLAKKLSLPMISMGKEIHKEIESGSQRGQLIKTTVENGRLIDNQICADILQAALAKLDLSRGLILNGFPRSPEQLKYLSGITHQFQLGQPIVINLNLPDEIALQRVIERGNEKREEKGLAAQKERLRWSQKETQTVVEYFCQHGQVIDVDGQPPIDEVFQNIIGELKNKNIL